jgi:hypothetical protein
MPLFKYKAVNKDGKEIDGQMSAKDKFELYHLLKNSGETVVSAEETREGGGKFSIDDLFAIFGVGGPCDFMRLPLSRRIVLFASVCLLKISWTKAIKVSGSILWFLG